jgi:CubicO group peptidase (beta-lactamase class C family)
MRQEEKVSVVHGKCDPRFAEVRRLLEASIESGDDVGASVAISLEGEMVVDLWGGWADEARTKPWLQDTIANVWSNTKSMVTVCALVLVERGELDVFAPVARYWPEFAANGKERIEVRHVMSHTSGLAGWDMPVTMDDIWDPDRSTEKLAAMAPWWEPGTAGGYHAMSYGHLMGEIVRRITGQTVGRFFREQVAGPLGADIHIGLPESEDHRVSPLILPPPLPEFDLETLDHDSVPYKINKAGLGSHPSLTWDERWRRSEITAAGNAHGNARAATLVQSLVSHEGEFNGVKLLSPETCALIFQEQAKGIDLYLNMPIRWGVGYALSWPEAFPYLPDGRVCFWAGWGGSQVVNDLDHHMTFSYIMNKMEGGIIGETVNGIVGGLRSEALLRATYGALA